MIRPIIRHLLDQPFVAATGFAALIHSTWTIGYMVNGGSAPALPSDPLGWLGWHVPPFLVAICVDIGQISTAHQIRMGNRSAGKYATFAVFSLFTYYFQLVHLSHVLPVMPLGAGVAPALQQLTQALVSAFLLIYPALLPLSTWLYTVSDRHDATTVPADLPPAQSVSPRVVNVDPEPVASPALPSPDQLAIPASTAPVADDAAEIVPDWLRLVSKPLSDLSKGN